MIRYLLTRAAAALLLAALLLAALLTPASAGRKPQMTGERVTERGRIDWEKGVLYATGLGAVSNREPNQAKAYLRARTFAKLDALRNLLMVVDHVRIDSQTTGKDYEAVSDEIRAEVKGIVRGAQIVAERRVPVGGSAMVEVTVATPMYGEQGIAGVLLPELIRRNQEAEPNREDRREEAIPAPPPDEPEQEPRAPRLEPPKDEVAPYAPKVVIPRRDALKRDDLEPRIAPPQEGERCTSLIIDARGMGVERSMSPKIRRPDGSEVWGTVKVNLDWLIEHGIVVYAHNMADARKHARAGDHPLVVRAVGNAGGNFHSDAVVNDADAERILAANAQGKFLDKYRVIFVVDPMR